MNRFGPGIWHVEQHHRSWGLHIRVRMVVVRLADDTLWLHSPVELDAELLAALAALGEVAHIVAPCHGHTRWAADAKTHSPSATLWGAPGLPDTLPKLPFDSELSAAAPWASTLDTFVLDGTPKNNEVVLVHRPSRTLICTDLVLNITEEPSWLTRALYRSIGVYQHLGPASLWRKRTTDRPAARASYDRVLAADFDQVLMAHGDPITDNATTRMHAALEWASR